MSYRGTSYQDDVATAVENGCTKGVVVCYLIESEPTGRTYCGFTNNLEHRIRQHNGELTGGAKSTSRPNTRPWRLIAVLFGLETKQKGLRLEWAIKHPRVGRKKLRGRGYLWRLKAIETCLLHNLRWDREEVDSEETPLLVDHAVEQKRTVLFFREDAASTAEKIATGTDWRCLVVSDELHAHEAHISPTSE